ncbi:hypothetical protein KY328_00595 [Candidatus Woesearchaeota archaeon]|nr:hypothetical protein [Candidatus Woesearchaeota archaeon]MBW3021395.1 hypothetical protein [Candidatus Woesearchaeota archaeon]
MKTCSNTHCRNNRGGLCFAEKKGNSVYCLLTEEQWKEIREYQEKRFKEGKIPRKICKSVDCINNIYGNCCLISEVNLINFLTEEQIDALF